MFLTNEKFDNELDTRCDLICGRRTNESDSCDVYYTAGPFDRP